MTVSPFLPTISVGNNIPEEVDEGSHPSHTATGDIFTVKYLKRDYLLNAGIWATLAFLLTKLYKVLRNR